MIKGEIILKKQLKGHVINEITWKNPNHYCFDYNLSDHEFPGYFTDYFQC